MFNKLVLSVLIVLSGKPVISYGQNKVINGVVKEKSTGEALPYAAVTIDGTGNGTTTNADGYFTLFNVAEGQIKITVQMLGYEKKTIPWSVTSENRYLTIELNTDQQQLGEVVVSGKQNMLKVADDISHISVSPKQLAMLPGIGEKDIFRSLQLLPGISGTNESSSGLYVRGGTPDQNLILFDGFTVYHVDHFYGFFSAFNANAIKDIQLYKGGFEPKFGGRTSSVVEITGKTGNEQEFNIGGEVGSISANVFTEIPLWNKGSILFAARRSYSEILKSGLYEDIFDMGRTDVSDTKVGNTDKWNSVGHTEPDFNFYDMNFKATYKPSDKDVISVSVYTGEDKLDNSNSQTRRTRDAFADKTSVTSVTTNTSDLTKWGNWGLSTKWSRNWNSRLYSNSALSYSNFYNDRDFNTATYRNEEVEDQQVYGFIQENNVKDISFRNDWEYSINSRHNLGFGAGLTRNDISYNYEVDDTTALSPDNTGLISSIYIQDRWSATHKAKLTYGQRFTYFDETKKFYFEPRVQMRYAINNNLEFKAAWGIYYQFINRTTQEDVENGNQEIWFLSDDETIPVQKAIHYILGLSYDLTDWLFTVEAYYKDMDGLSELNTRIGSQQTTEGENLYANSFFEGSGHAKGIEFLIQRKFGKLSGWIGYTLSQVLQDFPDLSDHSFPALQDQKHELKLISSYDWHRWTFAATWIFATGKPYTAPVGGYWLEFPDGSEQFLITVGDKNSSRLPDYHRLDASATYKFRIGKAPATLGLSIFNLYDRKNVWYKDYQVDRQNGIYSVTDVNYLGMTPSLFFSIKLK